MLGGGGGGCAGPAFGPISVGGGGGSKRPAPLFPGPQGDQPTACTLALWWLKFGPTRGGGGGVTAARLPNVSVLVEEALAACHREAAEGEQSTLSVAAYAGGAPRGEMGLDQSAGAEVGRDRGDREAGGPTQEEPAVEASMMGTSQGGVAMGAAREAAMGVAKWNWG